MQNNFFIRQISKDFAGQVIQDIGFDKAYIKQALFKFDFVLLKINDLTAPQANILKQLALSVGADCAVNRNVITCKIDKSSVVLGATKAQIRTLSEKLKKQPFKLALLSELLIEQIKEVKIPLRIRNTTFDWGKKAYIMGILNTTPDSFSDGGDFYDINAAFNRAQDMIQKGVDILDIGGESTRPNAEPVSAVEEIKRTEPLIKKIRQNCPDVVLSIDTRNADTAKKALEAGVDIINDVSGFDWDSNMLNVVAQNNCPVVIMHSQGSPKDMQENPTYTTNIIDEIFENLSRKVSLAIDSGIKKENIIIDPGIGFGKTQDHNIEILKRVEEFSSLGCAVLVGVSRKSVISNVIGEDLKDRDCATLAISAFLASKKVDILRVHDYGSHVKAFQILDKILY